MEPGTVALLTDAIKILGPAGIVAWATYRASRAQLELKLKEIKSAQEFGAREHLFRHYKDRQQQLAEEYTKMRGSLEETVGFAGGLREGSAREPAFLDTMNEYTQMYCAIGPEEINVTLQDMDKDGLAETSDYQNLESYKDKIKTLQPSGDLRSLQRNIFIIVQAYHFLQHCNNKLLQTQMERTFRKYLDT